MGPAVYEVGEIESAPEHDAAERVCACEQSVLLIARHCNNRHLVMVQDMHFVVGSLGE